MAKRTASKQTKTGSARKKKARSTKKETADIDFADEDADNDTGVEEEEETGKYYQKAADYGYNGARTYELISSSYVMQQDKTILTTKLFV